METTRRQIADWAEQYLGGDLSFQRFFELLPEFQEDKDVAELVDLVEHEPQRGGRWGYQLRSTTGTSDASVISLGVCGAHDTELRVVKEFDRVRCLAEGMLKGLASIDRWHLDI